MTPAHPEPDVPADHPADPARAAPAGESAPVATADAQVAAAVRTQRRPWSLRARLIGLLVVAGAVVLSVVDIAIPLIARSALINAKDQTLTAVITDLQLPTTQSFLENLSQRNSLAGEVGWSVVSASGTVTVLVRPPGYPDADPDLGATLPLRQPATVAGTNDGGSYRVLARGGLQDLADRQPITLVAWIPLGDVSSTIGAIVFSEVLVSLAVLALVGVFAGVVIRRELRPLEAMARVADGVASGDLSLRVDAGSGTTEVGRLGTAFNDMIGGISGLLYERAESEKRMGQFVADASHELRTPVSAIRGYTELYRAGALEETAAVDRAMDRMGFEAHRMAVLVEDLLTLSQSDSGIAPAAERVDLLAVLSGVVDDAAVIDRKRIWRLAGTNVAATVIGDRLRLHQLFANLLANVRTHTPEGTTATVSVEVVGDAGVGDRGVAVSVIDNGPGVAPTDLARLFDRFFRVDKARSRAQGGSGLGLSIAAAIARAHHGRIEATATPGGGLTVAVWLPLAPAAGGEAPAGPSGGPLPA